MDFALIHKERRTTTATSITQDNEQVKTITSISDLMLVGNVQGRVCILVDDIADTSHTITKAAQVLVDHGAVKVYALITHGMNCIIKRQYLSNVIYYYHCFYEYWVMVAIMSGNAINRLNESKIDEVIVSNTVPQDEHIKLCPKIKVFDVAPIFAEAIRRIHNGESVSFLFEVQAI